MYDNTTIKSYIISGPIVRKLREKFNIGFNEFCTRARISTRTLALIEKSEARIVTPQTLTALLIGFNLTKRGIRKKEITAHDLILGSYTYRSPQILGTCVKPRKMTVYVNRETRQGIESFAQSRGISEGQALLEAARNFLGVIEGTTEYHRNISRFHILGR